MFVENHEVAVDLNMDCAIIQCCLYNRFCEGLKTLGVLDQIRQHPDSFQPLFCHEPKTLTADRVDDLFSIRLSPEGSNKRAAEEMVVTFWRDYLQDAEGHSWFNGQIN